MRLITTVIFLAISLSTNAGTFTVTNTNNSGSGSLRDALQMAAFLTGPHSIEFNIPTTDPNYNATLGVWVITPLTTFDYIIKDNVTIDGTTQTTNQGDTNPLGPEIVLDGNDNFINYCFSVINSSGTVIKGFTISDFMYGIQIYGTSSINSTITGNYIGTNATATDTAGNYIGIEIIAGADYNTVGGTSIADRNIISGNEHIGIRLLDVKYCTVIGNYVGVDRTGTFALRNYDGVSLEGAVKYCTIGGTSANERNIISGNVAYGLPVFGAGAEGNIITGNYIGTDVTGTVAIPNTYGVLFDDGSYNNILGGSSSSERNILSGNSAYGVFIYNMGTNGNIVKGNYIGTDVNGTAAVPNAVGIVIDGAAYKNVVDSNVISGNLQQGISINITGSDSTLIVRNKIGTDINGSPLGNGSDGIRISQGPKYSMIGGMPSEANVIANNGGNGVYLMFANDDYHLISCNSIYDNTGLGIDLFPPGVNLNDPGDTDAGANEGMNYPEIDTVIFITGPAETVISGTLDTQTPELCTVQIFKALPDQTGHGEGIEYLSSVIPDVSGNWTDTLTGLVDTDFLTTIAIDQSNNTSEFSIASNSLAIASVISRSIDERIVIYPNPTTGVCIVYGKEIDHIEVIDIEGRVVKKVLSNSEHTVIDLSAEAKGLYLVKVFSANEIVTGKILLEKKE
ncbi:MAG: T9SS type A sorting domain-containing protein [Bacteroidota bacterium]